MNWKNSTVEERLAFCEEHARFLFDIRTQLDWEELSPTTQLLLRMEGVTDKAIYEA